VIIDTRMTPATIHHDPALPADLVLVIRPDGSSEKVPSTLATENFVKAALGRRQG
jgi:hypothetical protein